MGRATHKTDTRTDTDTISIHALRGEGDVQYGLARESEYISIHALRGEGDSGWVAIVEEVIDISIHALRGEGDKNKRSGVCNKIDFNPRPPWGGRLIPTISDKSL